MVVVKGIGWVTQDKYGYLRQGWQGRYENKGVLYSQLQKESVFVYPVKNFGRFDEVSKMACYAVALCLRDAGIIYSQDCKQDVGIIGTNLGGCLRSNLHYFKDYVEGGRKLARGNLFIYTLPSSSLAEAAIHFGFQGPLLYMTSSNPGLGSLLPDAGKMIAQEEAAKMVVIKADEDEAVCFLLALKEENFSEKDYNLDDMLKALGKSFSVEEIITVLKNTKSKYYQIPNKSKIPNPK